MKSFLVDVLKFLEIVSYKAYADLKSERQRTYLGFAWWIFEPLMYMLVMWLVFSEVLSMRTTNTTLFLLCGLVIWQWFRSCISHGSLAVLQARPILYTVPLTPVIFPISAILTDTFKFIFVMLVLGVFVVFFHGIHSVNLWALALVLSAQFALICAVTIWVSMLVPVAQDLRYILDSFLMAMMFLSGIFYDVRDLPAAVQHYFFLNPMAVLISDFRGLILDGTSPEPIRLIVILSVSFLLCVCGGLLLHKLRSVYPKLPV